MNYPNLNDTLFIESAKTHFLNNGSHLVENGKIYEINGTNKTYRYPLKGNPGHIDGVYIKPNHFKFWNIVSRYLPLGCYISNAYVPPETQARVGLNLFEENFPNIPIHSLIGNESNPELVGKYKELYLFQVDYNKLSAMLTSNNIKWARPNNSIHQRGLALDITFNSEHYQIVLSIIKWFKENNIELNLSGIYIKQSENELHIEFNENILDQPIMAENTYMMTGGINSPVSEMLMNKDDRFYEILKRNGHVDLIESGIGRKSLARLPHSVKHQNSTLAKAIREIIEDSMSGQTGLISVMVQSQLDYLTGLVNGLIGAMSVVGNELDPLTSGRASVLLKQAIESETAKTLDSTYLKNKVLNLQPLTNEDYGIIKIQEPPLTQSNKTKLRKNRNKISSDNSKISRKDTKNTPEHSERGYDAIRVSSEQIEVPLGYDHFGTIKNELVFNSIVGKMKYEEVVTNITIYTITHKLNSLSVKAYARENNGQYVIFSQTIIDSNNISVSFNSPFSGTIEVY